MKIGEFIQKHMNRKQINQAELARRSGVPASTISSIINRNNDRVAIEMMLKICSVLECDIEEYINSLKKEKPKQMPSLFIKKYYSLDKYGQNTVIAVLDSEYERCTAVDERPEIKYIDLKLASMPASAGTGTYLPEENYEIMSVKCTELTEQADFAVRVSGNSMEPTYYDGDILLIEGTPYINIGDVGVFVVNGDGYVKEYGGYRLISHNNDYDDIMLSECDVVICSGRVIGVLEE